MEYWWLVPLAYLAGSVPWGLLIVHLKSHVDVRDYGSGRIGVTNVLRTAGKGPAIVVLLADAGKGIAVVLIARLITENSAIHALAGGAVVVGHIWPVLAGFRGGRGIATGGAAAVVLEPAAALIGILVFTCIAGSTRYVSLGSILATFAVMASFAGAFVLDAIPFPYLLFGLISGSLIVAMHQGNISRLLKGTEPRLGDQSRRR